MKPTFSPTNCCAICLMRANNDTTTIDLKEAIENKIKEAKSQNWKGTNAEAGGQRLILCVTTPEENNLESNLRQHLNSKILTKFNRRKGYGNENMSLTLHAIHV
jgi:hypothetical protein